MGKEVIAVDVDEVVFPFLPEFINHYNQLYGTALSADEFLSYDFEHTLGLSVAETVERVYAFHEVDYSHVEPIQDSKSALEKLADKFDLVVITARDERFETPTKAWLDKQFGGIFSSVHMIGYAPIMEKPRTKAEVCQDLGARALIDDSLKHVSECVEEGIEGLLFGEYPWNSGVQLPTGVVRRENWAKVVEHFDA